MKTSALLLWIVGLAAVGGVGYVIYTKSSKTPLRTAAKQPGTPTGSVSPLGSAQQYLTAGQAAVTASENLWNSIMGTSGSTTVAHQPPPPSAATSSATTDDGSDLNDNSADDGSDYAPDDGLQD